MKFFACRVAIFSRLFLSVPTTLLILGLPIEALGLPSGDFSEIEPPLVAQTIPDDTLGPEVSQVVPTELLTERIEGGAIRGSYLFHSFEELNVADNQHVYFANPSGIFTILSRITGNNGSEILGTLGVDGPANLFLLNPNGIMFGPNASLDIQGSFLATTAAQFTFPGGEIFSATNPEIAPMLTMSAPLGIQFGTVFQGNISSTGNLTTGENLTLLGNQLYLEGQVMAGNDLTLQAQDTVTIRDTATDAFIAQAANNLTIQGNQGIDIWTLQHLGQTPFSSGGNLRLISDGTISGDAHFDSGGDLQFLTLTGIPGNFVSFHDPIIFADGDVVFGDYEGVALKVETLGSIQAGKIRITGPDTTLIADGSGSDDDLLASSSAVILRAGVQSVSSSNLPLSAGGTTFTDTPITTESPSSIVVTAINTTSMVDGGEGGPIILTAYGDITTNPNREEGNLNLDSFSRTPRGTDGDTSNGGSVVITSIAGDILINGSVSAFSQARGNGNAGNGGNISISSDSGSITVTGPLNSFSLSERETSGNADDAGSISIASLSGNISLNRLNSFSEAGSGSTSRAGDISISSVSGDISMVDENFEIRKIEDRAGKQFGELHRSRVINATSFSRTIGSSGNGGDVSISSTSGNIFANKDIENFSDANNGDAGNGGNILIVSDFGNVTIGLEEFITEDSIYIEALGELESFSISREGNAGNGGDIIISSGSGDITTEDFIRSFSFVRSPTGGRASNGGTISLTSTAGDITANGRLSSFASTGSERFEGGGTGDGGDIFISSVSGNITTNRIDSKSDFFSNAAGPFLGPTAPIGNGGDISITSLSGDITNNGFLVSGSISRNGDVGNGGDIFLSTMEGIIRGNPDELISTIAVSGVDGNTGQGGTVFLRAPSIQDIRITTVSSQEESGNIEIQGIGNNVLIENLGVITSGQITVFNPAVNTESTEPGQSITLELSPFSLPGTTVITSAGDLTLNDVEILSDANRSANAGNVDIVSAGDLQVTNSRILSNTNVGSNGKGGSVNIRGTNSITLDNSLITTDTDGNGPAGSISLFTPLLLIQNGTQITAATNSPELSGSGGDIAIEGDVINLSGRNTELSVSTNGPATAGSITLAPFIRDRIEIITANDGPQFSASTANESRGQGGDITIHSADVALLRNTELVTGSNGSGNAGNIVVNNVNVLLLRQGSLLQAGASADGDGGDIDIDATIVLTVPDENNDILADTNSGTGGNINITAASILGFRAVDAFSPELRDNQTNDISARSEQGNDGIVTLTTPSIEPDQGLLELPANLADQSGLIAQRCLADSGQGQSSFVVTGRGGLPPNPNEIVRSATAGLVDLGTNGESLHANHSNTGTLENSDVKHTSEVQTEPISQLVEAQGWSMTEAGNVQLVAQIPNDHAPLSSLEHSCLNP